MTRNEVIMRAIAGSLEPGVAPPPARHRSNDVADPFADSLLDRVAVKPEFLFAFTACLTTLAHGRPPSAPAGKRARLFGQKNSRRMTPFPIFHQSHDTTQKYRAV